ncbi:MAG: glycosyltransferase family 4 protein [Flavobacteriaceae bacterium]|nr:glycosyltransferase family 4 protein [Flavobacteriaceae bacterium]
MYIKKRLKVFVDGYLLNKEHQGTTTYIKEIYKKVAFLNPNTSFYIGCFKDERIESDFKYNLNVFFIYYKYPSRIFRMIFEIPKIIESNKIDYAHFQYVIPLIKNKKCKYIVTIHDILFNEYPEYFTKLYRYKRNYLFRRSAKKTDYLLTVSNYSKKEIKKYYQLKNKKIYLTPNGINETFFENYNKEDNKKTIKDKYGFDDYMLYVSRIEPRKNQELLLKIYLDKHIYKTSTHLVFIGVNSINNNKLLKLVKELKPYQKSKIHFYDNISQNNLLNFYKASKMFVYPSKAEGFGIPPLEAGALKIPVLCSNVTAMESFSFFEPNFFNPNLQEEFIKKFNFFFSNYKQIDLENIKNKIKLNYSWDIPAQVLTSIFIQNTSDLEN